MCVYMESTHDASAARVATPIDVSKAVLMMQRTQRACAQRSRRAVVSRDPRVEGLITSAAIPAVAAHTLM